MNNYMKSLLKLVDVSLCEKYTTKDNQSDTEYSIQDIKNILKYRFALDFDKDIECIKSNCRNLRLDGDCFLPKLLESMAKVVDERITCEYFNSESLEIVYDLFFDRSGSYYKNIVYYILNNIYLILMNINHEEYHNYAEFDEYFTNFDIEFKTKFSYDNLINSGRDNYKDSFMHTLFANSQVVEFEEKHSQIDDEYVDDYKEEYFEEHTEDSDINCDPEEYNNKRLEFYNNEKCCNLNDGISKSKRNRKQHQWCEANDAVSIATVYASYYSPFATHRNIKYDGYKPKDLNKFYNNYIHTLNAVISYNKNSIKNKYGLKTREYNKRNIFSSGNNCENHASLYLTDMIYGFSMLEKVLDVINNVEMTNIPDDEHKDIINEILLMCAELMLIPDIRNRNMLAKRITKKFLVNDIIAENDVLIEDVKKFSMYQSKVYYYIMVTYALLTIDHILETEKSDILKDKRVAEEYIRKIIYKGIDWFVKNKPLSEGQFKNLLFPIDDINFYFRKTRYTFYTKEYFEYYFSTDIFKLDRDNNMFLEAYFQMLMN